MKLTACLLSGAASILVSLANAAEAPRLPEPAGPYGIGRAAYDWTETARPDTLALGTPASGSSHPRELMVYLWYPTRRGSSEPHGVYLPGAKRIDADPALGPGMREGYAAVWPQILSGAVYSHAVEDAPRVKQPTQFPVVLFSHGLGSSGFNYTALIEALVSHGYVVAAIQHPEVADVVVYPDGRLVALPEDHPPADLTPAQRFQRMVDGATRQINVGAEDVRFVLDRLTELNAGNAKQFALAGRLDLNRVAAMGHSAGAEFAALACIRDPRFKACVDLDGGMMPVVALPEAPDGSIMRQPLLFLEVYYPESHMFGTHQEHLAYFKKKEEQLAKCAPGSFDIVLNPPGMMHGSYSDAFLVHAGNTPEQTAQALHNLALTQAYILAFLDKNMKHIPEPLLDDPRAPHPAATITPLGK